MGTDVWNGLANECKGMLNLNDFKHALKKRFFDLMRNKENDIYNYLH